MPAFADPRWEKACQARASGSEVGLSYKAGGFKGRPSVATRFFQHPRVRQRIEEIVEKRHADENKAREIATKKAGLDEAWIVERVKYGIEIALRGEPLTDEQGNLTGKFGKRNLRAAAALLALASDFKGMRIQRLEVGGPGDFARMSDQELDEALVIEGRALGLPEDTLRNALLLKGPSE